MPRYLCGGALMVGLMAVDAAGAQTGERVWIGMAGCAAGLTVLALKRPRVNKRRRPPVHVRVAMLARLGVGLMTWNGRIRPREIILVTAGAISGRAGISATLVAATARSRIVGAGLWPVHIVIEARRSPSGRRVTISTGGREHRMLRHACRHRVVVVSMATDAISRRAHVHRRLAVTPDALGAHMRALKRKVLIVVEGRRYPGHRLVAIFARCWIDVVTRVSRPLVVVAVTVHALIGSVLEYAALMAIGAGCGGVRAHVAQRPKAMVELSRRPRGRVVTFLALLRELIVFGERFRNPVVITDVAADAFGWSAFVHRRSPKMALRALRVHMHARQLPLVHEARRLPTYRGVTLRTVGGKRGVAGVRTAVVVVLVATDALVRGLPYSVSAGMTCNALLLCMRVGERKPLVVQRGQ